MERVLRSQTDYKETLLRNQLTSVVLYEVLTTTEAKAKSFLKYANRFLSRVRLADLTAKRLAYQVLLDKNAVKKVFEDILPRYSSGDTQFFRAVSSGNRHGDGAKKITVVFAKIPVKKEVTSAKDDAKKGKSVK